ncbi:hypothetical protein ACIBQX_22890 [Nonomuraea sp. NPDC049714]|uniref:hypothetical protein n=1 Tax=Nonomuraea sp. NPDC049714 TaxID=3364357 RepID=UPI0037B1176F
MSDFQVVTPAGSGSPGPGPVGRIVVVLLWLAVCLAPVALSVPDFELALGRTGTPGTLTVVSCEALGEGRYDCRGRFVPDSGAPPVMVAASPDSRAGDVTHARLTPAGDRALPDGARGVLVAATLPAVGLGGLGFLPYVIMHWLGVRRGHRAALTAGTAITTLGAAGAIAGMVAAYSS